MPNFESFEVQGVPYEQEEDKVALIKQIAEEFISDNPSYNFKVRIQASDMYITYHSYEAYLHQRMQEVYQASEKLLGEFEKQLKKVYKERSGHTLKMKQDKEYSKDDKHVTVEKVSMNNRYYFRNTRKYEI